MKFSNDHQHFQLIPRKAPKTRLYREDQIGSFRDNDIISNFEELTDKHCPSKFDDETSFPKVLEAIKVDRDLHVQLQFNGNPFPRPPWFTEGTDAKLNRFTMLENFPSYIKNLADVNPYSLLDEIENRRRYKPRGRPPYSSVMICYALILRYASFQCYKLLLETFPLPSISLLNKLQTGGVDAIKAVKSLRKKG